MTPTVDLEVEGSRATLSLKAIIDTGFDGFLCLPTSIAVELGLELHGQNEVELADGTQRLSLVFLGIVRFLHHRRQVSIYLRDSDDALIGTRLLSDCRLTVDFTTEKVRIIRNPPRRKKGRKG